MKTASDVVEFLSNTAPIVIVLEHVAALGLPDSWVAAGFIRNAIWDELAGTDPTQFEASDVDVLYFDPASAAREAEQDLEAALNRVRPDLDWQVRNQARMHLRNGDAPYTDTAHAMCHWLETPTAIAARLNGTKVELLAPLGLDDLVTLTLRPTAAGMRKPDQYKKRFEERGWQQRWPQMNVEFPD